MGEVTLATVGEGDRAEFVEAVGRSGDLYAGLIAPASTPAAFDAWLGRLGPSSMAFVARHDRCGALVGFVSVQNVVRRAFQSASLGYGAFAGHERRGLMPEAVGAVVDLAFAAEPDGLGLHRLEANIQPANAASLALVRRLGFRREGMSPRMLQVAGEWRDHERWALLSDDPRPARPPGG